MYESVLCVIRECMVYQIPPRTTARQYRAGDWDVEKPIWTGRLRVIAVGDDVALHLEDGNSGELFAKCPVDPNLTSVEPVSDSSRYFVIKIQDQASGKHAFVGLGFPERSWAFDMNVALQDHFKRVRNADKPQISSGPKLDLSLKEGQTISINIGSIKPPPKKEESGDLSKFSIAPPPKPKSTPSNWATF